MRWTSSEVVLNKRIKRNFNKLKKFCAENGLETFRLKVLMSV